jgi:pimeloyl-ACP methyl ester carboxylesterase
VPITDAVLVHGSFSSESSWDPVLPGLKAGGIIPHAICLPGHGRRGGEAGPDVDLHRHAGAVVDHVVDHNLRDIMLVGHSYGGMPVTQAWNQLRDRVASVVYVDAGVAADGQCQLDLLPADTAAATREVAVGYGDMLAAPVRDRPTFPLAIAALSTPIRLDGPLPAGVPRTLILATGNPGYHHGQAAALRTEPDWTIIEIESGHNILGEKTDQLVAIMLELAGLG